jgi:hypothetical protein
VSDNQHRPPRLTPAGWGKAYVLWLWNIQFIHPLRSLVNTFAAGKQKKSSKLGKLFFLNHPSKFRHLFTVPRQDLGRQQSRNTTEL